MDSFYKVLNENHHRQQEGILTVRVKREKGKDASICQRSRKTHEYECNGLHSPLCQDASLLRRPEFP